MASIECLSCGAAIEDPNQVECTMCGSSDRHVHLQADAAIEAKEQIQVKKYYAGMSRTKGWYETRTAGDDLHRKTGKWNRLERIIDRADNQYREHIEDRDGNVVHHCEEPLNEHYGHGSAKRKS